MTSGVSTTVRDAALLKALARLARELGELGLSLVAYGPAREPILSTDPRCEICLRLCGPEGPCTASRAELAEPVWTDGRPRALIGPFGCTLLAVPFMQRRRVEAVGVACYLTSEMAAEEAFARQCDRHHLDRHYLASAIAATTTHSAGESAHLLKIVQWLFTQELENTVAANELATLSSNLAGTYEELSLLYRLSGSMKVSTDPADFLAGVCTELLEVMRIGSAAAILNDRLHPDQLNQVVRAGELKMDDEQLRALVARHAVPRLASNTRGGLLDNTPAARLGRGGQAIRNLVAVPLATGESSKGVLVGFNKVEGDFDSTDLKLINSVGNQAAVFLSNHHLYEEVQELLMGVLHVLTASIDAKDRYTCGHSQRVALISRKLAAMCGYPPMRVRSIYLAGLLHDIGKIGVPETVLCKAGKLTEEEFATMKRHPVIGARILGNIRQMQEVIPGVLSHHERPDGRGYPSGLCGSALPIEGLIVGLADCFDAMTSSRTYRRALPLENVVAEIVRFSGTQFDPRLVDHLMSLDLGTFLKELRESEAEASGVTGAIWAGAA